METRLAGVPAILRAPSAVSKPPILLWHGFGPPASEHALMEALPLDDVPAVKVYLGLPLFGERAPAGGVSELARRQATDYASLLFEPSIVGAARELSAVVNDLQARECLDANDEVGLFGFSAAGAAVLFALAERMAPVRAAVTVNASTGLSTSIEALEHATKQSYRWTTNARELAALTDSVHRAAEIASGDPPPAVLLWHGTEDEIVGPEAAVALHKALQPLYGEAGSDDRLKLVLAADASHNWTEPGTLRGLRASVAHWFNRYL